MTAKMNAALAIICLIVVILCAFLLLAMMKVAKENARVTEAGCVCGAVRARAGLDPNVKREYEAWMSSESALRAICAQMPAPLEYEMRAIFERYKMSMINVDATGNSADDIERKTHEELLAKGIARDAAGADAIIAKIRAPESKIARADDVLVVGGDMVRVGLFVKRLGAERLALLRSRAESQMAAATRDMIDNLIGTMILRYASMGTAGQSWSVPRAVYDVLHDAHGARFEGFASPLNSQMIRYADGTFASAFADVDAPFGSVGSFFSTDAFGINVHSTTELGGTVSVVNPPFVESVMLTTAEKCIADCASANSARVFIIVPEWSDSAFFAKLSAATPYLEEKIIIPRGRAFFEADDKAITTTFNIALFVLSVGMPREKYDDVIAAWVPKAPVYTPAHDRR